MNSRTIISIAIVVVTVSLVAIFLGILPGRKLGPEQKIILEIWGTDEDIQIWNEIGRSFSEKFPTISIKYTTFKKDTYESILLDRLAEGTGPDIFTLKNSWVIRHKDKISPLPQTAFNITSRDIKRTYVEIVEDDLVDQTGEILGLPLFVDSLALFYNKDVFNSSGIAEPPEIWDDIISVSRALTKKDSKGDVTRAGIALGTYPNIKHAFEILSAFILQNGDPIIDRGKNQVELREKAIEAFDFYTSFADRNKQNYSWTSSFPNSLDAFAEGKAVMILGFSEDLDKIIEKNPHLNIGVTPFPQLNESQSKITYGSYDLLTVSKQSLNKGAAWQFILFMTSDEQSKKYIDKFKKPPARRDLISSASPSPEFDIFYPQSLQAKSWPIPNYDAADRLFMEAIFVINSNVRNTAQAIGRIQDQLELLIP